MSQEPEKEVQTLINEVDAAESDIIDYLVRFVPEIGLIGLFLLVIFLVQITGVGVEETVYVQLLITSGALLVSVLLYYIAIWPKLDKIYAGYKARKLCKALNDEREETQVLLTILIFMKIKQPKIKLSTVYNLEPRFFDKERLLKLLYQHS